MSSGFRRQGAGAEQIDIKAQLATIHNPVFPFSSPNVENDDRSSWKSNESALTLQYKGRRRSNSYSPPLTDNLRGLYTSKERHHGRGQHTAPIPGPTTTKHDKHGASRRRLRPGLQIVTNFAQKQLQSSNIAVNQVAAKQPEQKRNRARSILSQKGIRVLISPLPLPRHTEASSRYQKATTTTKEKKSVADKRLETTYNPAALQDKSVPTRSSVLFGLCVPEHEASILQTGDVLDSAITLITPATPQIVITPADEGHELFSCGFECTDNHRHDYYSSSPSLYSRTATERGHSDENERPPPTVTKHRSFSLNGVKRQRRASSASQEQILTENLDVSRPKSQGWWNLMLSPMLSRAGTLKLQHATSNDVIPPVPSVPADLDKNAVPKTPMTAMSPETPRRLGLADVRTSTWSKWTDVEFEQNDIECDISKMESTIPTVPKDYLTNDTAPTAGHTFDAAFRTEGLAAEYYHACAVEQLAGITYFECHNHSCAERLPQLRSIFDAQFRSHDRGNVTTHHGDACASRGGLSIDPHIANAGVTKSSIPTDTSAADAKFDVQVNSPISPLESEGDLHEIVSPNIRQAERAAFSKAKAVKSREPSPSPLPAKSELKVKPTSIVVAPAPPAALQPPETPGPVSPEATRAIAPLGAMSMTPIHSLPAESTTQLVAPIPQMHHALVPPPQPPLNVIYYPYGQPGTYQFMTPFSQQYPLPNQVPPPMAAHMNEPQPMILSTATSFAAHDTPRRSETGSIAQTEETRTKEISSEEKKTDKSIKKPHKRLDIACCFGRRKQQQQRKGRCWTICIAIFLIIVIALCILFALLFTRGTESVNPIESQWLNLTGYPPIPTGVSTIAKPNLSASQNRCTAPNTMWTCSVPKEDQSGILPNEATQPNFRFQIRFRNGTVPANMTVALDKRANDPSANDLFVPNPSPPGKSDQLFLGNTTDNVTKPFDGEPTPFFITFIGANSVQSSPSTSDRRLDSRQFNSDNPLNAIPAPSLGADGSAAPASLLPTTPFPISQPVKLYNRGLRDEHYGFYVYYDKAVFLSGVILQNGSVSSGSVTPVSADQNGGSTKQAANVRCTWAQTRFVVKMFTNPGFGANLLRDVPMANVSAGRGSNGTDSATNFVRPGSFPYPTTILLDRHGGDITKKLIYCYGMNNGNIVSDQKILVSEIRSFGGTLVNPSPKLLSQGNSTFDSNAGGIDGGTGGCGCTWQNWA